MYSVIVHLILSGCQKYRICDAVGQLPHLEQDCEREPDLTVKQS
jgi:hypothetical protein